MKGQNTWVAVTGRPLLLGIRRSFKVGPAHFILLKIGTSVDIGRNAELPCSSSRNAEAILYIPVHHAEFADADRDVAEALRLESEMREFPI